MIAKGQDAANIRSATPSPTTGSPARTFDYCLSNPPYGVDWKAVAKAVKDERDASGAVRPLRAAACRHRDGQMLFLQHLATRCARPTTAAGGPGSS